MKSKILVFLGLENIAWWLKRQGERYLPNKSIYRVKEGPINNDVETTVINHGVTLLSDVFGVKFVCKSWFCHSLPLCPWLSYLASMINIIYKMGMIWLLPSSCFSYCFLHFLLCQYRLLSVPQHSLLVHIIVSLLIVIHLPHFFT